MSERKEPENQKKIEADVIFDLEAIAKLSPEEYDRLEREGKLPTKPVSEPERD